MQIFANTLATASLIIAVSGVAIYAASLFLFSYKKRHVRLERLLLSCLPLAWMLFVTSRITVAISRAIEGYAVAYDKSGHSGDIYYYSEGPVNFSFALSFSLFVYVLGLLVGIVIFLVISSKKAER
jgi:hypothetical protein